jgi:hypothetical protein
MPHVADIHTVAFLPAVAGLAVANTSSNSGTPILSGVFIYSIVQ